jgi:hypothetical protein
MEKLTKAQQEAERMAEIFAPFIDAVSHLTYHFQKEEQKATLKRFEFSYSFQKEYGTDQPLFELYFNYNDGYYSSTIRTADQLGEFNIYCKALHDVAYAMER